MRPLAAVASGGAPPDSPELDGGHCQVEGAERVGLILTAPVGQSVGRPLFLRLSANLIGGAKTLPRNARGQPLHPICLVAVVRSDPPGSTVP